MSEELTQARRPLPTREQPRRGKRGRLGAVDDAEAHEAEMTLSSESPESRVTPDYVVSTSWLRRAADRGAKLAQCLAPPLPSWPH